ncbi:MAG TPA: hypothetical protein VFC41_04385 [Anaerovoracaceae bacterium]|nr:hypothetical protein [Anaerovoracaceae bacterium]
MKNRKLVLLVIITAVISTACLCGALNSIVDRLPLNLTNQSPEQIATAIFEQVPDLATLAVGELQLLTPVADSAGSDSQFDNFSGSLDNLQSYRSQLVIDLNGKDENGDSINETNRFLQEINNDQKSSHLAILNESNGNITQNIEVYSNESNYYFLDVSKKESGLSCSIMTDTLGIGEMMNNFNLIQSSEMFKGLENGELIQADEMVNGIKSDHYQISNVSLSNSIVTKDPADVWVAQDGGYVVRFIGKGEGVTTSLTVGATVTGEITWQYELTDINQISAIEIPQICLDATQNAQQDLPILDNPVELNVLGQIISYKSTESSEQAANFYKEKMSNLGYAITSDLSYSGLYNLIFTKDGKNVNISIFDEDDGGSSIMIIKE